MSIALPVFTDHILDGFPTNQLAHAEIGKARSTDLTRPDKARDKKLLLVKPQIIDLTATEKKELLETTKLAAIEIKKVDAIAKDAITNTNSRLDIDKETKSQLLRKERILRQEKRHEIIKEHFSKYLENGDGNDSGWQLLINQFIKDSKTGDYRPTRYLFNKHKPNFLLGVFQASYYPGMEDEVLGCLTFDVVPPNPKLEVYTSNATSVTNVEAVGVYTGFRPVAGFPENWAILNNDYELDDSLRDDSNIDALYFVDRFRLRFEKYTSEIFQHNINPSAFPFLNEAINSGDDESLEMAVSFWLNLHEYFHRQGLYGRDTVEGVKLKSTRETGAFEELRVDLDVILFVYDNPKALEVLGLTEKEVIFEFILAERLLRYAAQANPDDDFDAIVSQVILNYLQDKGAVVFKNNKLSFKRQGLVLESLRSLRKEMDRIETIIDRNFNLNDERQLKRARAEISKYFMRKWANKHLKPEELDINNRPVVKNKNPFARYFEDKGSKKTKTKKYSLTPAHNAFRKTLETKGAITPRKQYWACDLQKLPYKSGSLYLATISDIDSGEVIALETSAQKSAEILDAVYTKAYENAGRKPELLSLNSEVKIKSAGFLNNLRDQNIKTPDDIGYKVQNENRFTLNPETTKKYKTREGLEKAILNTVRLYNANLNSLAA